MRPSQPALDAGRSRDPRLLDAGPALVLASPDGRPAWHTVIPPVLFGGILAGAAALGLLGSLLPARIAPRASPVRALGQFE